MRLGCGGRALKGREGEAFGVGRDIKAGFLSRVNPAPCLCRRCTNIVSVTLRHGFPSKENAESAKSKQPPLPPTFKVFTFLGISLRLGFPSINVLM